MTNITVTMRDHSGLDGSCTLPVGNLTLWSVDNLLIARTGWEAVVKAISTGSHQSSTLTDVNSGDAVGEPAENSNAVRSNKMVFKWRDSVNAQVKGRITIASSSNAYEVQGTNDVDTDAVPVAAAIAFIEANGKSVLGNDITVYDVIMSS